MIMVRNGLALVGLKWGILCNGKSHFFFSRKRNMRISGFNILLSQILCSGFRPTRTRIQNRFKYLLKMTRETSVITGSHAHSHGMRSRAKRCASQSISSSAFTEVSYRSLPVTKIIWWALSGLSRGFQVLELASQLNGDQHVGYRKNQ